MKAVVATVLCFWSLMDSFAQKEMVSITPISFEQVNSELMARKYELNAQRYRLSSPRLIQFAPSSADRASSSFWTSAITTQSYGKGKVGTLYYWDVQGNLREMRGFIDIAGKNKRGLKLVFPWR